jgi:pimeloyl-ACP methyl ester carboxylesterase
MGIIERFCFPLNGKHSNALSEAHSVIQEHILRYTYHVNDDSMNYFPDGAALWITIPSATKTILFAHGNMETIVGSYFSLNELSYSTNCNVFAFEYPGYAGLSGSSTDTSLNQAAYGAYEYLTKSLKIDPKTIILMGRSIGSGPIVSLASRLSKDADTEKQWVFENENDFFLSSSWNFFSSRSRSNIVLKRSHSPPSAFAALILISPLASIRIAAEGIVGSILAKLLVSKTMFNNVEELPHVRSVPIFIFHGTVDSVLPYNSHASALTDAYEARVPADQYRLTMISLPLVGHNDIPMNQIYKKIIAL